MNVAKLASLMIAAGVLCGTAQAAEQLTGTLQKIKDTGVITLGVRESSIPFNYNLGGVRQVGYSYDINVKIVEAIKDQLKLPNLQVKEIPITSQNRITLLQNGTIDIECGSTTNNLERQKQASFTTSIFIIGTRIMVKKDGGIKDWADLKGKNVVTTAGTTSERLLRKMNDDQKLGMNIISTKDHGQSFLTLESGRAVAFMMDDALLYGERAKAKNPADWIVVAKPQSRESYGCMIRKDDAPFKKLSDTVITGMMKDGSINTLYTKWFQQPVPPKGLNLDFPLSEDMKALFKTPNDKALD
ncbi:MULTISPECIES: glutamate/aspartate ABC transporter substrate-binding protein [Cupriavidus]|uniref:glutamate/aspartate ABC transporter substrate-binding protein n=1 Tax=Cupriavidus TaxID=106589 RepID=UPI0003A926B1|nr:MULTISPECIES: glutamate/aspartate ABC transporter substrate-binding protein [Cupriavidus]